MGELLEIVYLTWFVQGSSEEVERDGKIFCEEVIAQRTIAQSSEHQATYAQEDGGYHSLRT